MGENTYCGACLCGAVRYEVSGAARMLCVCHCESCRRATGAPAVPWGTFARDVTLATLDEPARFEPRLHVWVGDKPPWESINDGRPQFTAGAA